MSAFDVIPISTEDYRRRARLRLPRFLFDYIDGGANDEATMAENIRAFGRFDLRQRVMRDVSEIDLSTTLLGQPARFPMALAPVGMAGMMRRRGETLGARAAARAGIPFATSTVGICPVEEVQSASPQPFWFQLYMLRDREFVLELLGRAKVAGCETLVFTVDLAVPGLRLRDFRNGMLGGGLVGKLSYAAALATSPLWLYDVAIKGRPHSFGNLSGRVSGAGSLTEYKAFVDSQFDPSVTWKDIAWLREQWAGKLLIKGVMEPEDAVSAADVGADGVIVSNHGGRQLDGIAASVSKLPHVVDAIGERAEVLLDGGVRSGIDVLKALALGARGVLIGRPWVFAMAARGEEGIVELLSVFEQEINAAMALTGVTRLDQVTRDMLEPR